jgi:predicted small secreted protein
MKYIIAVVMFAAAAVLVTGCSTTGKKVAQSHSAVLHEGGY